MAGGNFIKGRGELKPEIRLRLYNEAIAHFESARAHFTAGRTEEALKEIRKATGVVRAFPEAYALAQAVYLQNHQPEKAREQDGFFRHYGGNEGVSLYRLRNRVAKEVALGQKFAPPPDFQVGTALGLSGVGAGVLVLGMLLERVLKGGKFQRKGPGRSLFLEPFPDEEEGEPVSWFFKLCILLLPAPLIFTLLVSWGLRNYSEIVPILLFAWILTDLGLYLIFFADLSSLGGLRPGRRGGS